MALSTVELKDAAARRRALVRARAGGTEDGGMGQPDERVGAYLEDPLLRRLYEELESVGRLRAITVDLTHVCQLRCQGCYFFVESMDSSRSPREEADFEDFIEREKRRGTNYVTVLGGEPSLRLDRLKKLHDNFLATAVTNGIRRIPQDGFETLPIAVSVWGDHETDTLLRGKGRIQVFRRALGNYRNDPRVLWYFTVSAGNAHEVESVVTQCVENGNYVYFNYYEDNSDIGGMYDHRLGFERVREEVDRMIDTFPDRIISTTYLNQVATTNRLYDMTWGYDVCPTISANYEKNRQRTLNGHPYNHHFRAYNPDLQSVRRCCVGEDRDCSKCYNAYARHTWIMINKHLHLGSKEEFTNWLTSVFTFYMIVRAVDFEQSVKLLPEIHERLRQARDSRQPAAAAGN
jgi:hypothetical protein